MNVEQHTEESSLERRLSEAAEMLESEINADLLVDTVTTCLRPVTPTESQRLETFRSITTTLEMLKLPRWSDSFDSRLEDTSFVFSEPVLLAVDLLLGRALGRLFAENLCESQLVVTRDVLERFPNGRLDFLREAENRLRLDPKSAAKLATILRERISQLESEPNSVVRTFGTDLRSCIQLENSRARLIDAWGDQSFWDPMQILDPEAFYLLEELDSKAFLEIVELIPSRYLAEQIIDYVNRNSSLQTICALLRISPQPFNEAGVWKPESKSTLLLLACLEERLCNSLQSDGVDFNNLAADIETELNFALDALVSRPDMIPLGYTWLQHTIWKEGARPRRLSSGINALQPISVVSAHLATRLKPHPSPVEWVETEELHWRNERATAVCAVMTLNDPVDTAGITSFISDIVQQDLLSTIGLPELFRKPSFSRNILGHALANLPEGWFPKIWQELFWLRERTRHLSNSQRDPSINGSLTLVFWALCALGRMHSNLPGARSLWSQLEAAIREGMLTSAIRLPSDNWTLAQQVLAKHWKSLFPEDPPRGTVGSLDDFLAPFVQANLDFAYLITALLESGVSRTRLQQLPGNIALSPLLQQIASDIEKRGNRSGLSPTDVERIKAVASECPTSCLSEDTIP